MSYLVFARKFRPQTFDEVVGQDAIVATLKNAIRQKRVSQSFLFSGPRGIGKTSTARILAKALNCAQGPTETPCDKCPACTEITLGNSLDVLEIDGASNRGIDEIRNLRETVKFKPITGRYKVYIIDEVHMLTTEAFNALLKTLEEPPPHVKFIFATTEPHKVLLTILSRCQRFNFKRIPTAEIEKKLEEIAKSEKLKFEANALFQIAKAGDGSLRDAEGLLDQLATFSEEKIKEEDVLLMLGLASEEVYFSVLSALRAKDTQKIFSLVEELYNGGRDLVQFAKGLLEIFRHLLLFQCAEKAGAFVDMSEEGKVELKKHKDDFSRGELLLALSVLGNLQNQLRRNLASPRLLVETVLLKLLHLDGLRTLEELVEGARLPATESLAGLPDVGQGRSKAEGGSKIETSGPNDKREEKRTTNHREVSGFKEGGSGDSNPKSNSQDLSPSTFCPPPSASNADAQVLTLDQIEALWPEVIERVKAKRMSSGIFLSEAEPVEVSEDTVTLGLPSEFQFHKEMLEKDSNRRLVEESFEAAVGRKIRLVFVITQPDQEKRGVTKPDPREPDAKMPEIITQALNIFEGAKIIKKE